MTLLHLERLAASDDDRTNGVVAENDMVEEEGPMKIQPKQGRWRHLGSRMSEQ